MSSATARHRSSSPSDLPEVSDLVNSNSDSQSRRSRDKGKSKRKRDSNTPQSEDPETRSTFKGKRRLDTSSSSSSRRTLAPAASSSQRSSATGALDPEPEGDIPRPSPPATSHSAAHRTKPAPSAPSSTIRDKASNSIVEEIGSHSARAQAFLEARERNAQKLKRESEMAEIPRLPVRGYPYLPDGSIGNVQLHGLGRGERQEERASSNSHLQEGLPNNSLNSKGPSRSTSESELDAQLQVVSSSTISDSHSNPPLDLQRALLEIQRLKKEVSFKEELITAQRETIGRVHDEISCGVCMEVAWRPYVVNPCGHMFCLLCLLAYFRRPLEDEAPLPALLQEEAEQREIEATLRRKKQCPSCREVITVPPTEVWAIKSMVASVDRAQRLGMGGSESAGDYEALLEPEDEAGRARRRTERGEDLEKGVKVWENIFAKMRGAPIWDDDDHVHRCALCTSEIERGVCSNPGCGEVYSEMSDFDGDDSIEGDDYAGPPYHGGPEDEGFRQMLRNMADGLDSTDEEDEEEMQDFIVRDDEEDSELQGRRDRPSGGHFGRAQEFNLDSDEDSEDSIPRPPRDWQPPSRTLGRNSSNGSGSGSQPRSALFGGRARGPHYTTGQQLSDDDDDVLIVPGPSRGSSSSQPARRTTIQISDSEEEAIQTVRRPQARRVALQISESDEEEGPGPSRFQTRSRGTFLGSEEAGEEDFEGGRNRLEDLSGSERGGAFSPRRDEDEEVDDIEFEDERELFGRENYYSGGEGSDEDIQAVYSEGYSEGE